MTDSPPGRANAGPDAGEAADADAALRERAVETRLVHAGRVIDLRIDTVELADGERRHREIVEHPGAVAIVALDGGDVLLVRQYRHAAGRVLLEIPAGTRDRRPDGSLEPPAETASRELAEETGHGAARWRHLGTFWTAPGFATEAMDLYLASELAPVPAAGPAADERLALVRMPWRRAVELCESGTIADAKSIVGLFWLARLADRGEL